MLRQLHVRFDSEIFAQQFFGGISRYYTQLMRHLPPHGVMPRVLAPLSFNHHVREASPPGFRGWAAPRRLANRLTIPLARHLSAATDALALALDPCDLIHHTYYGRRTVGGPPSVVTVVDMIPELFPAYFPDANPHGAKLEACRRASLVLTISECTKRDLLRLAPDLACPVRVTHLAADDAFQPRNSEATATSILFVGAREGYKNFGVFATSTAQLLSEHPDLDVQCVGGGPLQPHELLPYKERGVLARVTQRNAADRDLPSLYQRARVFVFPSRYEGFGLPILEAFACGCPTVLSRASCFPEIAEDAAIYFDPDNSDDLLEALRRVVMDRSLASTLRRRGLQRLQSFSWNRTAEQTAQAYKSTLEHTN